MGQNESSFKRTYEGTVAELSSVQLGDLSARFNDLYAQAGGSNGHVVDRKAFSKYFNLPVSVGDRLFDAFDKKNNGKISFEEFVCGLALVLHGSFHNRCALLFEIFNIHGDEGVSRAELTTMLSAILQSTDTILYTVSECDTAVMGGEDRTVAVKKMVDMAFENCDITRTGKLLPLEFEYWLKCNPKVLDTLLLFNTIEEECTLGPLIMSPSEQAIGVADPKVGVADQGLVVSDQEEEVTNELGVLRRVSGSPLMFKVDKNELDSPHPQPDTLPDPQPPPSLDSLPDLSPDLPPGPYIQLSNPPVQRTGHTSPSNTTADNSTPAAADNFTPAAADNPTPVVGKQLVSANPPRDEVDSSSCLMEETTPLAIDLSCDPKVSSSKEVGPESPVIPTTSLPSQCLDSEDETVENTHEDVTLSSYDKLRSVSATGLRVHLTTSISEPGNDLPEDISPDNTDESFTNLNTIERPTTHSNEHTWQRVSENVYSAWIPGPSTASLLSQSQPTLKKENLTCPALVADISMSDPIGDLLTVYFSDAKRMTLLSVDNVSMDVDGLRKLVVAGCYHSALQLTSMFLSAHGQGLGHAGQRTLHTHKTLQMWSARLSLLVHLNMYKEAETEMSAFGELVNPDLYYEFHFNSYPDRKGSLVPFTMRLVHAVLPSLTGDSHLSLDRLCTLKYVCTQVLSQLSHGQLPGVPRTLDPHDQSAARELWQTRLIRVTFVLGNVLVSLSDYHCAAQVYESIIDLCPSATPYLYSGLGRLSLNLGDLKSAQKYFAKVDRDPSKRALVFINDGLVNVYLSRWQTVKECFTAALQLEPDDVSIKANLTVCTFYLGRLKESIEGMEQLLTSDLPDSLQPSVFTNLSAAYELESGQSLEKKLNFIPVLGTHVCEGFQLQALNIR